MARGKKKNAELLAARKKYIVKNNIVVSALVIGAALLCVFIGFMQNYVTEMNQKSQSTKILEEVTETLRINDETVEKIETEFNGLNTTTLQTLDRYIEYIEIFNEFDKAENAEQEHTVKIELSKQFKTLADDIDASTVYLIDTKGEVIVCSQSGYVGANLISPSDDDSTFDEEDIIALTTYTVEDNVVKVNGTTTYGETTSYNPILIKHDGKEYYTYSCYFGKNPKDNSDYFLLTSVNTKLLNKELESIKKISSVLEGVSVGKTGFLFSLDTHDEVFSYFVDQKSHSLTGEKYSLHGITESATKNNFAGYQTIDGTKYYCVTEQFHSATYGDFTIIAAVVAADELVSKIAATVAVSCLAFVIVAAIVVGYGMIIRRDIADHTILLEKKYTEDVIEAAETGGLKYTEEEVRERVSIKIEDSIESGRDQQLSRLNIGTRNAKGIQSYFSKYMFKKILPVVVIGSAVVFGISFFSQTLLALQEANNVSQIRINDVELTLEKNDTTSGAIREYISEQYISKLKLISYLLEEHPEYVFDFNYDNDDVHRAYRDSDGLEVYSIENSEALAGVCDLNNLSAIYIYDENGQCIATNTEEWYYNVNSKENERLAPLSDVIRGWEDHKIEDVDLGSDGVNQQYIAYKYHYYTYVEDGKIVYTSKENYFDKNWSGPKITSHRSVVQVELGVEDFKNLFEVTKLSYILNNLHVFGEDSFFVAFDLSDEHKCIYSPIASSIGRSATELGLDSGVFRPTGSYNGFITVNGIEYYSTFVQMNKHYIATAIPTSSIYESRNTISLYTLVFAILFNFFAASLYMVSNDASDLNYISYLKLKNAKEERKTNEFLIMTANGEKKTSSASSRYTKVAWKDKTVEQKLGTILMGYLFAASAIIIAILIGILLNKDENSIFTYIFSGDWDRGFNVFSITAGIMILILIITASNLIEFIVKSFCGTLGARIETLGNLLVSVVKYGGVIGGIFYVLYLIGFDTSSLLASAGLLGIVVGLGAQSLISDIIAGMFIVFEGEFRVGDIVTIGDFRGQVIEIGLRTTKLQDISNNIKIFNNSAISGVLNMTKETSFAFITVGIEYGESLERVEAVLKKGFPAIKRKLPAIVEGPIYKGVLALNTSSVDIGIVAQCSEQDRVQLTRDLNREIFLLFNKNNINIPFPQVTVSYLNEDGKGTQTPVDGE